jgi:hypothetical protein
MKLWPSLALLMLCFLTAYPQQEKVVVRFLDAVTNDPVYGVAVADSKGVTLSVSDSLGYCTLPFGNSGYLLAMHAGYSTDTLRAPATVIYMQPLSVTLGTTIIRSSKINRLLRAGDEYVADYCFRNEELLIATYSGNNGSNAKLYLVTKEGEELTHIKVPKATLALYRSCLGNFYCICADVFYPIAFKDDHLNLKAPYNIGLLRGLRQCEQEIRGNLFYRISDRSNFRMLYGMIARGDSQFKPLVQFDEKEVARASFLENRIADAGFEEYDEMHRLWDEGNYRESYRQQLLRTMWDNGSFAHIDLPLFSSGDSVVIFDYFKKRILFYNSGGRPLGQAPIQFVWKESQRFEIIKDDATDRFYIHRYDNKERQTVEELDIKTGLVVSGRTVIGKPFPELVRVHGGDIYFLYHGIGSGGVRQLYVQHEAMVEQPLTGTTK